jgi:hypothetical protein
MRRSKYRRASTGKASWFSGRNRIIALAATAVAFGGIVTVTQVSNASTTGRQQRGALSVCDRMTAPNRAPVSNTKVNQRGQVADDGAGQAATTAQLRARCRQWVMQNVGNQGGAAATTAATTAANTNAGNGQNNNGQAAGNNNGQNNNGQNNNGGAQATTPPPGAGLGVLTNSCDTSKLPPADGFQKPNVCVSTEFGEVGAAANNPSLLITNAPTQVAVNQPFTLTISSRNLIRDRFLAAGAGGYYVESSVLNGGIERGHFHTACRILQSLNSAPAPDPVPAFFVATEDKKGGRGADSVQIQVPGLPQAGTFQCASWSGDGSHRIPMMERANQTPAMDAVRIRVTN